MSSLQKHTEAAGAAPARASSKPATTKAPPSGKGEMTLHQLRIFWAVAHAETLTKAAKQLGLTQPSLSQQLSKLETTIGARLFDRTPGQMELTDAGEFLLRKAEAILAAVTEANDGLRQFSEGTRTTLRIAGLHSALRVLLPGAARQLTEQFPEIELDVHEAAPAEVVEMLYARRVNIGLVAENSLAQASVGFRQIPVAGDPYVFAVPEAIDLDGIADPDHELGPAETEIVNSCIQFTFGTQHTKRVEQWYAQVLPHHRLIAQCRSYDTAISMVQAGLGVCLLPALTAFENNRPLPGLRLYRATEPERMIVALVPGQYQRVEPYRSFLDAIQKIGAKITLSGIEDTPPFLQRAENI